MREPNMMVDSTSRPWSSVPSRNLGSPSGIQAGGLKASRRFRVRRSNGLCGAIHGARNALPKQTIVTIAATMVSGDFRKL
jgi:hypothetical protein